LQFINEGGHLTVRCRNRVYLCFDGQNSYHMEEGWQSGKISWADTYLPVSWSLMNLSINQNAFV